MPGIPDVFENAVSFWVLASKDYDNQRKVQDTLVKIFDVSPTCRMLIVNAGGLHDTIARLWTAIGGSAEVIEPNWRREGKSAWWKANENLVARFKPEVGLWFSNDDAGYQTSQVMKVHANGTRVLRIR